jgi:hypothetical protein
VNIVTRERQGLSDLMLRAHRVLKERGQMRTSDVGWALWGATTESPNRGSGSHGQNKFCRAAGKVLRGLERAGRAQWKVVSGVGVWEAL